MRKRALKIAIWAGVAAIVAVVSLVVTVLVILGTDYGRQTIVDVGSDVATDALNGSVKIGELNGSLFSDFTFRDIVVADERGHEMARVDRIRVAYELSALFDDQVHVKAVEIDGPRVRLETMADGRTNFEHLVPPSDEPPKPEEPSGPPPELEVLLDRFTLDGFVFAMGPVDTATTMVERGAIRLSARAPLPNAEVKLERLSAYVVQQDLDVLVSATAAFVDEVAKIENLVVRADDHPLVGVDASFAVATTKTDAKVRVDVPADLVRKLSKVPELELALTATITAEHAGPTKPWTVKTVGNLAGATIGADAKLPADLSSLDAKLAVSDLDPAPIHPAAPKGDIDVVAFARGPLDGLTATASITAADVRAPGTNVDHARITADITGIPEAIEGIARVRARGLEAGGQRFGNASFDVTIADAAKSILLDGSLTDAKPLAVPRIRAAVALSDGVSVDVQELALATRDVEWRGESMKIDVTPAGTIVLEDIALASRAGSLTVAGRVEPSDPLRQSRDVALRIDALDLGAFSQIVPGVPKLAGRLDVGAFVDAGTSSVSVSGSNLAVDEVTPLNLDVLVNLAGRKLNAAIDLDGRRLGSAKVRAEAKTPADPLDVPAWRVRPLDRIENVEVVLDTLDLGEVGALAKVEDIEGGRVDAKIVLAERKLDMDVDVQDALVKALSVPLDAALDLTSSPVRTDGRLDARLGERRVAEIDFGFDKGLTDLERRGAAAVRQANGKVEMNLERLSLGRLVGALNATTTPPLAGVLTGNALIEKKGVDIEAHIDMYADDARGVPNAPLADGRVHVDLVDRRLDARLWLEGEGSLRVDAHAVVQTPADVMDAEAWKAIDFDRIQSVTASVSHAKLGVLGAMSGTELPSAELEAAVRFGPGLSKPSVYAGVRDVRLSPLLTPVGAVVTIRERGRKTHVELGAFANERPLLDAIVDVPKTVRQLAETNPKRIGRLPLNGRVRSPPFAIENLFAKRTVAERFAGTLDLLVNVAGVVDEPKVDAKIAVNGLKIGEDAFERFQIDAKVDGKDVTAKVAAEQTAGGKLSVDADVGKELEVAVAAEQFGIDFVAELLRATSGSALGLSSGKLDAKIDVTGEAASPKAVGTLLMSARRIVAAPGVPALDDAKIDVVLDGGDVEAKVRGEVGDGPVRVDTKATVFPAEALAFSTSIETERIRVTAGTTAAVVSMSIQIDGKRRGNKLEVDVVSDGGTVLLPGDPGGGDLHPIGGMEDVVFVDPAGRVAARRKAKAPPPPDALQTIVRVRTKDALKIEGDQVRTAVEVALDGRTMPEGFALDGTVQLPRGQLKLISHEYEIERAKVVFDGHIPIVPRVDVALTKDFGDTRFNVLVSGTAKDPDLRFTADPPIYTQGELMQIFLGGEPGVESSGEAPGSTALGAAAGILLGPVTQALRQSLPIDTIDFSTASSGEGGNDVSAALTLGKWITDELFVATKYTFETSGESGSSIEGLLRYRFSGTWVGEVHYFHNYGGSAEVLWVKRF